MLKVEEDVSFIGISELRKETPTLLKELRQGRVILTRRNKPVGVIINYSEYEHMKNLMERVEDMILGYTAKIRTDSKKKKYISLEEAERRVGLK
jgi:prevent-host-death family protein